MFASNTKKSNSLANSQQKFRAQLKANERLFCNRNFESASGLLRKSGSHLKQTKLSLCQKEKKLIFSGFVEEPIKAKPKHEFVYNPVSSVVKSFCSVQNSKTATIKVEPQAALPTSTMLIKPERNLLSLIGCVAFGIKMNRTHPKLNALWNIYGQLIRIVAGKRGEQTLLLRNEGKGPILQAIFYDFDDELKGMSNGCYVSVVGRFIGDNRLNTFSVSQVSNAEGQQNFTRIENVISYILMQKGSK